MTYINGSDILLLVAGKPVGHCSTHTVTYNSETKERAVKPAASEGKSSALWKGKGVTGLSISISAEGMRFYDETENGYEEIAPKWGQGASVDVVSYKRGVNGLTPGSGGTITPSDADINVKGKFIIASLEEVNPAQDDSTYSISLENDGEPDIYPGMPTE